MLTEKFVRATELALKLHATQLRKGTQIPYTSHLLGVASLVLENGGDEEQAIAVVHLPGRNLGKRLPVRNP